MTTRPRKTSVKAVVPDDPAPVAVATSDTAAPETAATGESLKEVSEPSGAVGGEPAEEPYVAVRVLEAAMVLPNPNPFLILEEVASPHRQLSIPIGFAEGTAIGFILANRPTPKPLTHELFLEVLQRLGGSIARARVTHFAHGGFYAEVVVAAPDGELVFSCRPSDAIALALRQGAATPVLVATGLLAQVGAAGSAGG